MVTLDTFDSPEKLELVLALSTSMSTSSSCNFSSDSATVLTGINKVSASAAKGEVSSVLVLEANAEFGLLVTGLDEGRDDVERGDDEGMKDFRPCADGDTDGDEDSVGGAEVGNGLELGCDPVGEEVGWDDGTIAREGLSLGEYDACSDGVDVGRNEYDGVAVGMIDGFNEVISDGLELSSCDSVAVAVGWYVGLNVGLNVSGMNNGDLVGMKLDADNGAESAVLSYSHDKCGGGSSL